MTGKHIYTDPLDGSKLEWDAAKNAWVPLFDDEFLANYQEQDLILIIKKKCERNSLKSNFSSELVGKKLYHLFILYEYNSYIMF